MEKYLPVEQENIISKAKEFIAELKSLPKDIDSYGLIHGDIHEANIIYNSNKNCDLGVIDFDDSEYEYFIEDIAVTLWSASYLHTGDDKENREKEKEFLKNFITSFMKGYRKENTISKFWMSKIDDFFKLRKLIIYSLIYQIEKHKTEKRQKSLQLFRDKFLKNESWLGIDFSEF